MTDEQPPIKGAPTAPGEAEAAAAERVAEGLPNDVELDESGFGAKLQELENKGFHTDYDARILDDDGDTTVFDDGTDILAAADLDGQAARPEAGRVPDAPGDGDPAPTDEPTEA